MIIAITPEHTAAQEQTSIPALFAAGLDLLHVRKYSQSREQMQRYLESIPAANRSRVVLHTFHDLAQDFGVHRLHFGESQRSALEEQHDDKTQKLLDDKSATYSTSTHDIARFNRLDSSWEYAFLSPIFPSLSKPGYGVKSSVYTQLSARNNNRVKLIGLGGIQANNVKKAYTGGLDGVALLGALWLEKDPLKVLSDCKKAIAKYRSEQ